MTRSNPLLALALHSVSRRSRRRAAVRVGALLLAIAAIAAGTAAWAHGDVTPQAVDTHELPQLGAIKALVVSSAQVASKARAPRCRCCLLSMSLVLCSSWFTAVANRNRSRRRAWPGGRHRSHGGHRDFKW